MYDSDSITPLILYAIFGIILLFFGLKQYLFGMIFRKAIAIDLAQDQYVTLEGNTKKITDTLEAPLSGKKCLGYYLRATKRIKGLEQLFLYDFDKTILQESKFIDFILKDDSGFCLVKGQDVKFIIAYPSSTTLTLKYLKPTIRFSSYNNINEARKNNDLQPKSNLFFGRKQYAFYEYCLEENDVICAQGQFKTVVSFR